jgi:hypothetical protein
MVKDFHLSTGHIINIPYNYINIKINNRKAILRIYTKNKYIRTRRLGYIV